MRFPRSLCRRRVHPHIVERREGRDHCQAERLLARNQVVGQDAPGALSVANADRACVVINCNGKLRASGQNFFRKRFWDFYAAGGAEMSAHAVGDVSPAFEEDSAGAIFDGDVQAAFKPDAVVCTFARVGEQFVQRFRALPRSLHQFFAGRWRVADAALNFVAQNFERRDWRKFVGKAGGSFLNCLKFGPPGAPDGDAAWVHGVGSPVSAVYWETRASFMPNFGRLRKTGGKGIAPPSCLPELRRGGKRSVLFHRSPASKTEPALHRTARPTRASRKQAEGPEPRASEAPVLHERKFAWQTKKTTNPSSATSTSW